MDSCDSRIGLWIQIVTEGARMDERRNIEEQEHSWDSWSVESVSLRNPWLIAGLVCIVLIALIIASTFVFGLSRDIATIAVRVVYFGFWGVAFLEQLWKRHWVRATAAAALLFAGFLEP